MKMVSKNLTKKELGHHVEALGYRLLVRAPRLTEKNSLIIIPYQEEEKAHAEKKGCIGKVLAIGPTAFSDGAVGHACQLGDWVIYSKLERELIEFPDQKDDTRQHIVYAINDANLIAIIDEKTMQALMVKGFYGV